MLVVKEVVHEIEEKFKAPLDVIRQVHALGVRAVNEGHAVASTGDASHRLALFMLSRATTAFQSVELLWSAGLEVDATSAMRVIAELLVDFEWMWQKDRDDRIRLFVEYIMIVNQRKLVRWIKPPGQPLNTMLADKLFAQMDKDHLPAGVHTAEEYIQWIESEYERVRDNYDEYGSWAGISIRKRAIQANLQDVYDLHFALGSEATHSGPATLSAHYALEGGVVSTIYGPSVPSSAWILGLTASVYGHLIEVVAKYLNLTAVLAEARKLGGELLAAFATAEDQT